MKRKQRGVGHPVTTNSAAVPVVSLRLSEVDHEALSKLASDYENTPNGLAKFFILEGLARARLVGLVLKKATVARK